MWRIKGLAAIALACGMAVTSVPLTAEADDRKYISSISLKVHVELDPEMRSMMVILLIPAMAGETVRMFIPVPTNIRSTRLSGLRIRRWE